MTDENFNADNSVDSQQVDSFSQNAGSPVEQQAPDMAQEKPQDGSISQEKLTSILLTERRRAYEKGVQEANQRVSQAQEHQQPSQASAQADSIDQKVDMLLNQKLEEMRVKNQEDFVRHQEEANIAQIEGEFSKKMEDARKEIDGFDDSLKSVGNFENFRGIKYAAIKSENGAKVLHYLSQKENQKEIPILESMARSFQNGDGTLNEKPLLEQFKRISDKISLNEKSDKYKSAPNPLSSIQPSLNEGMGDGSRNSVTDYRSYLKSTRR